MADRIKAMKALVKRLNEAAQAYYAQDTEIMSNYEYDALYDQLQKLEQETGIVLSDSPTVHVGYEAASSLPKKTHDSPMLSLDKTKDTAVLADWLGDQKAVLSWKMDGLTIVLRYEQGELAEAVTRGNGYVGEIVTANARVFKNIPHRIAYKGTLILRGEAVIRYSDFNRINENLQEGEAKYKNPRNLCSGAVRQLNNKITASRNVYFYAFSLVRAEGVDFANSSSRQFDWLTSQGFDVVEHVLVDRESLPAEVEKFAARIGDNDFPSDGLVLLLEDIAYGASLGTTAKFPRNAMAFKWADETARTHLLDVEWSASRTGLINPVAVFEPVQLEGTTVSRASVHNISVLRALQLGIGDELEVYKANMIIPQIAENLTRSDSLAIPSICPVCGSKTVISDVNGSAVLLCPNPDCQAKHVKLFAHFVSRDAMNVEGLSESTVEKFIQKGFLREPADLFHLGDHRQEIMQMDGFGEKSMEKLQQAVSRARTVSCPRLIYSLGIPGVGLANAKLICSHYKNDLQKIISAGEEELTAVEGIGPVLAASFAGYFRDPVNRQRLDHLLDEVSIEQDQEQGASSLKGMTFVITGSLEHFSRREQLKEEIEKAGGRVAGSVSSKTTYLINNDKTSSSSKNKKARQLGVPVISEEEILAMMGSGQP